MILRQRSRPSWKQGFARSADESAFPNLWTGLVGAWIPSFGPTGDILFDVSRYKNHGTLTDMDSATDWVIAEDERISGYALVFLGGLGAQYIDIVGTWSLTDWTIYLWVKSTDTTTGDYISDFGVINQASIIKGFQDGFYNIFGGAYPTGTAADSQIPITAAGVWDNVVWTQRETNIKGFVNGVEHISVTRTGGDFFPGSNLQIGRTFAGGNNFGGQIADYRIWDHAKTANEIQQLYEDPLAPFRRRKNLIFSSDVDLTTPVSTTKVSPAEFLSFITNLYKTPINVISSVSPTYKIITEILGTISPSLNKIPTEVLAGILLSSKPLVETIGTLAEFQNTPVEFSGGTTLTTLRSLPIEYLAEFIKTNKLPIDSLLSLAETSVKLPIESLLAISDINKLPIETIGTLLDLNKIPVETLLDILDLSKMSVEMLQGISNTLKVPIEILQGINSLNNIPVEFAGATVITVQKTVPIEFIGTLLEIENLTVENLAPVSDLRRLPVEYLQGISTTNTKIPLISLLTILGLEKLPVGYILELIKANKTPIDSLLSLDQFDSLPIDALLALSQTDSMPVEFAGSATTAVEVTKLTPIEIIGFLSENRSMPVENRGILVITKKTAIEALLAVAPDNFSTLVEALGGVGPLQLIPVESFGLSIATKIKQWVLANRGQMWILPKREFDWKL